MNRAVFLDRDGVVTEDVHLLTTAKQLRLLPGVPAALRSLKDSGYLLLLVTNQTVVARGLITEAQLDQIHQQLQTALQAAGAPRLDGIYVCPHHPRATLAEYRVACDCRKPRAGLLRRAAKEWDLHLPGCFIIGDRLTDIAAGAQAGCRTVLVETGQHLAAPIETVEPLDATVRPNWTCADLLKATHWIKEAQ
jgi:D-glycero-D-manno-heptose 1,7-bisphosphate phosphatase